MQHTCVEKEEMAWYGGSNSSGLDAYVAQLAEPGQTIPNLLLRIKIQSIILYSNIWGSTDSLAVMVLFVVPKSVFQNPPPPLPPSIYQKKLNIYCMHIICI